MSAPGVKWGRMTEEQPQLDPRNRLDAALRELVTDDAIREVVSEALSATKKARGWCGTCQKQVWVDIPDSKATVQALEILLNQAKGRPDVAHQESQERIMFVREVHE